MADSIVVGLLRAVLSLDSAQYESGVRKAADSMKTLSKDLDKIGRQATDIGKDFTVAFTVPIVGGLVAVSKAAIDFETSFAGVKKTVDGTEEEFAVMAQAMRDLAKEIPVSVEELNRLGEAAGALGIPKAEIVDFARVMAELGVTTNLTSTQAAESIAKIQAQFQAAGVETENFASALVALGNAGASTEVEILSMATNLASSGQAIGLSQADVLGFAEALASLGLEAERGGTALSRVFIDIAAAVSKGGVELHNFAEVANRSSAQFAELFKKDSTEAVLLFVEGLGDIKESGGDVLATLEALGISEIRLRDALLRLAQAGDMVRTSVTNANEAWKENTALSDEAGKRFATTEAQMTLLWNRIKDVAITLGNALLPMINATIGVLNQLMPVLETISETFAALPMPIQAGIVGFGLMVAAIGPLLYGFGQLAFAAGNLAAAFGTGGIAMRAFPTIAPLVVAAFTGIRVAVGAMLGPVGLVITAFTTLAAILSGETFQKWLSTSEDFSAELVRRSLGIKEAVKVEEELNEARSRGHDITLEAETGEKKAGGTRTELNLITQEAAEKAKQYAEEQKKLTEALSGATAITAAQDMLKALEGIDLFQLTPDMRARVNETMDAAIAVFKARGMEIPPAIQAAFNESYLSAPIEIPAEFFKTTEEQLRDQLDFDIAVIEAVERAFEVASTKVDLSGIDFSGMVGVNEANEFAVAIADAFDKLDAIDSEKTKRLASDLRDLGGALGALGSEIGGTSGSIVTGIGGIIDAFGQYQAQIADPNFKATAVGTTAAIVQGFVNVAAATDTASVSQGILNGAMAGAGAAMAIPGVAMTGYGIAIGAAAGAITGWIRASDQASEAAEQLKEDAQDLADEWLHGVAQAFLETASATELAAVGTEDVDLAFAHLTTVLADFGMTANDVGILMDRLKFAQTPEQVEEALNAINVLLEDHSRIMTDWAEGVNMFVEGFTTRVAGFVLGLDDVRESTISAQEEFTRLGEYAVDAFAVTFSQSGSVIAALDAIRGPLEELGRVQQELGLQGSAAYERLRDIDGVIQANRDIFTSLEGINSMIEGLDQATLLTHEDMILFGRDAVALFDELVQRMVGQGVPAAEAMDEAMLLMQPTLQLLWEGQERFGLETDAATQDLIDQAVAAGIVGEEHKSIQSQILSAIQLVEQAILRLPQAFVAAQAAAQGLLGTLKEVTDATVAVSASGAQFNIQTRAELEAYWQQAYAARGFTEEQHDAFKRQQNQTYINLGYQPPYPEVMHAGGIVEAHDGMYVGLESNERMIKALVGEGILNPWATAMLGGRSGIDALNTDPWGAVQGMAGRYMPQGMAGSSISDSGSGVNIGTVLITVNAPGGDPRVVEEAARRGAMSVFEEVERGGAVASKARRVLQQILT